MDLENLELATEMGGLVENLPNMTEIVHPKGFVVGRKDARVEGEKVPHEMCLVVLKGCRNK